MKDKNPMQTEQFNALMAPISSDLAARIARANDMDGQEAILALYASGLYAVLEREETKLWQYSTEALYTLFRQEQDTGHIEYPEP